MELQLLALSGPLFQGLVREINLTTDGGQITVLPHHAVHTAIVRSGPIEIRLGTGGNKRFETQGGLLEINADNTVRLLVAEATDPGQLTTQQRITEAATQAAKLKAELGGKTKLHQAQELLSHPTGLNEDSKLKHRRHRRPL
jgi:F0F1-type ATP synthase epsilon subunit